MAAVLFGKRGGQLSLGEFELGAASIYVVYPHRRHLSAKIRAFVDYMVAWFERHGEACRKGLRSPRRRWLAPAGRRDIVRPHLRKTERWRPAWPAGRDVPERFPT